MNTKQLISIVRDEISADRLLQNVKEVSCYHRIQASNGYYKAAKHCCEYLTSLGINANVLAYQTNGEDFIGPYKLFKEWNIQKAYCDITYPVHKRIADFTLQPTSILQKSYPCDVQDVEVVLMDRGIEQKNYEDIDFQNKIIFVHESFKDFMWAVQDRGAIGYISDFYNEVENIRNKEEMQDSMNYTSMWWKHTKEEKPAFGFVLTPREGKELTKLCVNLRNAYDEGKETSPFIRVNAFVDAKLFDGHFHVVEATLSGKSEESILVVAHLCHPCASANDNASGVSGAMEVLRSLKEVIHRGALAPLEKTIKLILVPEFTGTFAYLNDGRDISKIKAGINLDMIGGRQVNGYGPITNTHLPHALPSFVDILASVLMKEIKEDTNSVEKMQMSLVNTLDHGFQLGSDHFILSDPMVNIPCIMLGQWPDKNYHTSTDTVDKIDPNVIKYSTTVAASYVYALANQAFEVEDIILEMRVQYLSEMNHIAKTYTRDKANAYDHLCAYYIQALKTLSSYMKCDTSKEVTHLVQIREMFSSSNHDISYSDDYKDVPERLFFLPVTDLEDSMLEKPEIQSAYREFHKNHPVMAEDHCTLQTLCDYYVDGKRNIAQIYECVHAESGMGEKEDIFAYIQFMKRLKMMQ